jgi:hypothetical protein
MKDMTMARLNRTPLFIALMTLFTLPPALEAHQPEMDPSWASMSCEKSRNNTTSITIFSGNDTSLSYSKITTNFSEIIETSDQMTDAVKEYQRLLDAQAALSPACLKRSSLQHCAHMRKSLTQRRHN